MAWHSSFHELNRDIQYLEIVRQSPLQQNRWVIAVMREALISCDKQVIVYEPVSVLKSDLYGTRYKLTNTIINRKLIPQSIEILLSMVSNNLVQFNKALDGEKTYKLCV